MVISYLIPSQFERVDMTVNHVMGRWRFGSVQVVKTKHDCVPLILRFEATDIVAIQ